MKVIIFDMDDTLLNDKKEVSSYTLNILNKVRAMDNLIVINTARSKFYNQVYFDLIKPDYAILNGGSLIINKNEDIIYSNVIDEKEIKALIKDLVLISKDFSLQTKDTLYTYSKTYKNQGAIYFDFMKDDFNYPVYKVVARLKNLNDASFLSEKYDLISVPYLGGDFYRLNKKTVSKENGNRILLNYLNLSNKDSIVFGDDLGDLRMIKESSCGVLMKNADPKYYKEVKNITEFTNDLDGVAKFLAKYFKITE